MRHACGFLLLLLLSAGLGAGTRQATAPPAPAFEVASVKLNQSGESYGLVLLPGGRLRVINGRVGQLVAFAYQLPLNRIFGLPTWEAETGVDINAAAPDDPASHGRPELLGMTQRLLEERFSLRAHREVRDLPIYLLQLAREDGRLGATLRRSTIDCAKANPDPPLPSARDLRAPVPPHCGLRMVATGGARRYLYGAQTMGEIAAALGQAGLRLAKVNGPVEILVIDSIEKPLEN